MSTTENQNTGSYTVGDTGNGFITGVQPAQPRQAADWQQQRPDQAVSQPVRVQEQPATEQRPAYRWTDEDIEKARQQEKDKLYGRIEDLGTQMKEIQAQREAEQAEKQRLADEADQARKAKEESELDLRALMDKREAEMRAQVEEIRRTQETEREIFSKERALQEVAIYRRDRIEQEGNDLLPELRDFVAGDTPEAIDASIEGLKLRSQQILMNILAQEPAQVPYQPRGAAPTAPPVGPMEQLPSYESLTPEDIKGMDMETYKRYRTQLLQATSPNNRRG
jgi:hypothetical protein